MTAAWMTKYGPRRVRYEPPTLEEAITAAEGLTDDAAEQVQIAADLIQLPAAEIQAKALEIIEQRRPKPVDRPTAGARKILGNVLVERRNPRRIVRDVPRKSLAS